MSSIEAADWKHPLSWLKYAMIQLRSCTEHDVDSANLLSLVIGLHFDIIDKAISVLLEAISYTKNIL